MDHYLIITINSARYSFGCNIFEYPFQLLCHDYKKTSYPMFQALFPFDDWWVVPAKVAFDQTVWAAIWNSIYFAVLGILRFESPISIFTELKTTFLPMLTVSRETNFHPQLFHEKTRILSYIKLFAYVTVLTLFSTVVQFPGRMEALAICSPCYLWCDPC